ncbi:MAG: Type secretion system protein [Planctomycetota bacterium]|jgi:type II secretory pathway component PulF
MFRTPQMPTRLLAELFGRLAIALGAGVDLRRAWASEAARVPARWRPAMERVARRLAASDALAASLRDAAGVFPPLVCSLVEVGERTGREPEIFRDLAASLAESDRAARQLRAALVKPALQLVAAAAAVGVLIVVSGSIGDLDGRPVDILGLGLKGMPGLMRYLALLAVGLGGVLIAAPLVLRSWRDRGIVRQLAARLPVIGPALVAGEAAAWCRAAAMAGHAGLDAGRLVELAAGAAPGLRMSAAEIESRLRAGATLDAALAACRRLPPRVIEAVGVGELTGTTPEVLDRLAPQLEEEARAGLAAAVTLAGWAVWAAVALLIALIVVRFFSFYAGLIEAAGRPL